VTAAHATHAAAHDQGAHVGHLHIEERLDGLADLDLVGAAIDLEEELVLRLAQEVPFLGQHQRTLDDVLDLHGSILRCFRR
jgi:hypothetical protein